MKIAVLGAGAWGTALACHAARRHHVSLWARDAQLAAQMRQERANGRYLPEAGFPSGLDATGDWDEALQAADLLVIATPLAGLRSLALRLSDTPAAQGRPVVWMCKGLEASTALLPHEVLEEVWPAARAGALSGPSFAAEVAAGLPVALVVATTQDAVATACQDALHHGATRIYRSDDLAGVETGGALKNIMAIAAGICDGLALGMNARAALLTRGLAEMARYAVALGARRETLMGLAGMGDLVLTCTGSLSRNRQVGLAIGEGATLAEVLAGRETVAEGVATTQSAQALAERMGVEMPIVAAVHRVLFERQPARWALVELMNRDLKEERA